MFDNLRPSGRARRTGAFISGACCASLALVGARAADAADTRVCVDVVRTDPGDKKAKAPAKGSAASRPTRAVIPKAPAATAFAARRPPPLLPPGQTAERYMRRLIEHFVTHRRGFVAVRRGCKERIRIELYPLHVGWTVFARYSGHGREERVDQLYGHELSQFAERAVLALLGDKPISRTIKRDTVLRSDSARSAQRIGGTNHFIIGLGTQLRGGLVDTRQDDGSATNVVRLFSPMTLALGYRGKFENWAIDTQAHVGIGTGKAALSDNASGGHVDLGGNIGLGLHFLLYMQPRGLTSLYFGAGGTFELLWFNGIKAAANRGTDPRTTLFGGGLNVDLVFGYEFMRASSVQFVLQGELSLPAYVLAHENSHAGVNSWFPGAAIKLAVMF